MPKRAYILIAIAIVVALLVIFFVSYYFNKKTPVPKGCENLLVSEENCSLCDNKNCSLRKEKTVEDKKEEE